MKVALTVIAFIVSIVIILTIFVPAPQTTPGQACGGFAGETGKFKCPAGYRCVYPEPTMPDQQGECQPAVMGQWRNFVGL